MGSCVSKKAARAGAVRQSKKVAAPLPPVKEVSAALSPVVEEEEVKEVVLSETPAPRLPRPPPPPEPEPAVKKGQHQPEEEEACSGSESASVASAVNEKFKPVGDQEVEKRALDAPEKGRGRVKKTAPEDSKPKIGAGNGRTRSPSPSRRQRLGGQQQLQQPPPPRPRREQPAVVSGIGCRSGRFSPSAARRAAESAVRRTHSAREADMSLPAKRSLNASIYGSGNAYGGGSALSRRDPGERSGRRPDSPTASKRTSPSPSPMHRQASATRKAARESLGTTPERTRPRASRDGGVGGDDKPALLPGGGEQKKLAEGALVQNPSVAMECFIFL